jgi:hypothetical protein
VSDRTLVWALLVLAIFSREVRLYLLALSVAHHGIEAGKQAMSQAHLAARADRRAPLVGGEGA